MINPLWMQSLSMLMSLIVGRDVWALARDAVSQRLDAKNPSAEKFHQAAEELRARGVSLRTALVHLAIQAAYVWLTSRNGRAKPASRSSHSDE